MSNFKKKRIPKKKVKDNKMAIESISENESESDIGIEIKSGSGSDSNSDSDSDNEIIEQKLNFCEICKDKDDIVKIPSVYCKQCDHYYCEHHNQTAHSSNELQNHICKRIRGVITIKDIVRFHAYANIFLRKFYPEYFIKNKIKSFKAVYEANQLINKKVALLMGNSSTLALDAIQNAADPELSCGGGGMNSLIHRVGGIKLTQECKKLSPIEMGNTILTKAYNLPSKYVLHTAEPKNNDPDLLRRSYESLLEIVKEKEDIQTVGLCAISIGTYEFPIDLATNIVLEITRNWLEKNLDSVELITFVVNDPRVFDYYQDLMIKLYFPIK
ncbi:poly [adp-ribose] polymerase [Anaeramoeba flamelloides]|uniref:Poly [adp-ribose] polymerase n=1 Tax=Anaeramoeba flamelloides TaxID=1746091 RepID=A0AAV7ZZM1_9EUKA|nr:poly [adp-ribose] polymerase [Anaeramoeba flamelloides]